MVFFLFEIRYNENVFGGEEMEINQYMNYGDGRSESIYIAALKNDCKYILNYIKDGNILDITDERKQTLLHLATRNKALQSLQLLLTLGLYPNKGDKYKDTPLHIASFMGNVEMIKYLL